MDEHDSAALMRLFTKVLEHVRATDPSRLHSSDLELPILEDPTCKQLLEGHEGGEYDPERLGVACIVVPPLTGRGRNSKGAFNLNP